MAFVGFGAASSGLPRSVLKKLGIKSTSVREFILANGEIIKKPVGNAYFEYEGQVGAAPVIFGEGGSVPAGHDHA